MLFNHTMIFFKLIDWYKLSDIKQDSLNFLNNRYPNIKLTIETQINHSIVFLDVLISGINNQNLTLRHITIRPIQDFSQVLRVLHHFHIRLV